MKMIRILNLGGCCIMKGVFGMKMISRITAVLLTVVLCISVLGAAFCLAEHTQHDCAGENCIVCAVLEQCSERMHAAISAASAAAMLLLFALYAVTLTDTETCEAFHVTPVTLKVKLLN